MNLPFTIDQFLEVFRRYNEAVWPTQIVLNMLALIAVGLAFWKNPNAGKLISYILALLWFWTGIMYHFLFFSPINPVARVFGGLFLIQGGLIQWFGGVKDRIQFEFRLDARRLSGAILIIYALLIYPLIGGWIGHTYPLCPTFGAPCPTTIFTFGILLWVRANFPRFLLIIPALWSFIGFSAALNMGIKEDIGLLVAGIVGTAWLAMLKPSANTKTQD